MEALREVTEWVGIEYRQPNHVYLMDGSKAVAYIKWGEGEPYYFKKPLEMDKRGRKFEKADIGLFSVKKESALIEVKGSKGNSYWVDPSEGTCTCPGFTFRGKCRHVEEVNAEV